MTPSLFETYSAQLDAIKKAHPKAISNIYEDATTLQTMCASAQAQFFSNPQCVLLLTVKHSLFYECWYLAADIPSLQSALEEFLKTYEAHFPIRFMLVGKDAQTRPICDALVQTGCVLRATFARRLSRINESIITMLQADYTADIVEFAKPDDAQEVFALLSEEFDIYADNLPEFQKIQENIKKQQVAIIRKDKKIALVNYFEVKHHTLYAYYDVVRKEYRNDQLYFSLILFLHAYIRENKILRDYEWRNTAKKRLAKNPIIQVDEKATIYIHFYVYTPASKAKKSRNKQLSQ